MFKVVSLPGTYTSVNTVQTLNPSAFSIITDLMCTGLPIVVLWNVQISGQKKIAICALMATGLL